MKVQRQWLVEAQTSGEERVIPVNIWRAPVIGKRSVQSLRCFRVDAPKSLARHPIKEVVARSRGRTRRRRELSGIVGSTELIESRISFATFDIVEGSHGRRLFARSESDLRNAYRHSTKLWNPPGLVMSKGFAVFCLDHRFHIEVANRHDTQFKRRSRRRIKGLEVREQIAQRISHRLEDEGCRVMLSSVEILPRKLTNACCDSFIQPSLLQPPGIKAKRIRARHAARTS